MNALKRIGVGIAIYVWLSAAVVFVGAFGWIGAGIATGWIGLPVIVLLAQRSRR